MLGIFNLLPLLKGWEYKFRDYTRAVNRGQSLEVDRISTKGWVIQAIILTNDCYGGMRFKFQGADLDLHEFALHPNSFITLGAIAQDPSGWAQLYYQPNPFSSAGIFIAGLTGGWEGFAMPFVPTTILEIYLDTSSTQSQATVRGVVTTVEITKPESFIRSLRSVIGSGTVLDIDPVLLTTEPGEITREGPDESKEKS